MRNPVSLHSGVLLDPLVQLMLTVAPRVALEPEARRRRPPRMQQRI
jgi:hypothetical protein